MQTSSRNYRRLLIILLQIVRFYEAAMRTWHQKFEEMELQEYQKFLESLGISAKEIKQIRSV